MKKILIVFIFIGVIFSTPCKADQLPLWEVGFGLAGLYLPDYRGSDESRGHLYPVPYLMYRGKILKVERDTIRGEIFKSDRLQLDISLGGGVSVSSDKNKTRLGMPDLDFTAELGPSLEINLWESSGGKQSLWLKLPVRTVFSVSSSDLDYRGLKFAPYLNFQYKTNGAQPWKISLSAGPIFANRKYHEYFYEVEPVFVTPQRPEYHPKGGYGGSRITLTAQSRFKNFWIGAFARYDTLNEAVFEESPLVKSDDYMAVGLVITWVAFKSKTLVDAKP